MYVQRDLNNKITSAWTNQQFEGQEFITNLEHPDYLNFLMIPKINQIRLIRNQKLDEIDLKFCNAQKWSTMTQVEKDNWTAIKTQLIAITDKDKNGEYVNLNIDNVDSFLSGQSFPY